MDVAGWDLNRPGLGTLEWSGHRRVAYRLEPGRCILLAYRIGSELIELSIELEANRNRWWMRCSTCNSRVRCLYLPPNERHFGCRACQSLTYRSCQTHDQRKSGRFTEFGSLIQSHVEGRQDDSCRS